MEEKDMYELMFGKESTEKANIIENGLKEINEKYIEWFKSTPSKYGRETSNIDEFVRVTKDGHSVNLGFEEGLPEEIQAEVTRLFDSVYKKQ